MFLFSSFHNGESMSILSSPITMGGTSFSNPFELYVVPLQICCAVSEAFQPLHCYLNELWLFSAPTHLLHPYLFMNKWSRVVEITFTYNKLCRAIEIRPNSCESIFMCEGLPQFI